MENTGLEQLRTRRDRCDICRANWAEAKITVGVYAFIGTPVKEQKLVSCGDCALLSYAEIENALERATTMMKMDVAA
jgi:hypothetical protein